MTDIAISLVIAGVGSLMTWGVAAIAKQRRNSRLREAYPVAGRFITAYGDQVNGREATKKSITTLSQKGRDVTGKTVDLDSDRAWILRGTIEPAGGFLHGVYRAEDPHDPGTGTFFLNIEGVGGDMHGLWAGFDSANSSIDGGSYTFRRCPEVSFRAATDTDAASVCALLGDALGELYVNLQDIRDTISPQRPDATCLIAVNDEGQIVGAVTVVILDRDSIPSILPKGQESVLAQAPVLRYHERICVVRAAAVDPRWRGRGVGTELVVEATKWSAARGATAAVSFGWKSSSGCEIAGVMATTGFNTVAEVENFWTADSQVKDYYCPECGEVCVCSAVVFIRPLGARSAPSVAV